MAYRALYRTYRPKTFSEVVGQKPIIRTLQNALKEGKLAHAYLFCGPRGTGKTTVARLFAKALNCAEGVGHECGHCEDCVDILQGKHPDVYEIDAASNSGVDNVRALIEQVGFAPILGRYKVYIIDEVHSMTGGAFNALLKTLEEPPENVIFILATTEPDKILPTILSRVQRFNFSKVSDEDIIANMKHILEQEKVGYEEEALKTIARIAQGGVRDSLSLLDQAISYSGEKVTAADVDTIFGLMKVDDEIELVKNIHLGKIQETVHFVKDRYAQGADILRLHDDLTNIYKDLLIYGTTRDPSLLTFLKPEEAIKIAISPSEIRSCLNTLIKARREYRSAASPFDTFEMTLLDLSLKPSDVEIVGSSAPNETQKPVSAPTSNQAAPAVTPAPIPAPVQTEAPAKEETPSAPSESVSTPVQTIRTSTIDEYVPKPAGSDLFTPDQDFILNIMVQGNKQLKNTILHSWDEKLSTVSVSDPSMYLANELKAKTVPVIATEDVLVVKSLFQASVQTINRYSNQEAIRLLMKNVFGMDHMKVVALIHNDYIDYVRRFMELNQAGQLPDPKPIVLPSEAEETEKEEPAPSAPSAEPERTSEEKQADNASRFLDMMGFGKK